MGWYWHSLGTDVHAAIAWSKPSLGFAFAKRSRQAPACAVAEQRRRSPDRNRLCMERPLRDLGNN